MITIRELLKKINEVAPPIPGDEKAFVALHKVEPLDLAGHDSIHKDISPYGQFLKNVAAVKSPAERASHGYSKPGESEKAYSSANNEKINEAKDDVTAVEMHYHNPKTGKKFQEVHFTPKAADKFRKQHENNGFKLLKIVPVHGNVKNEGFLPLLPKQKKVAKDILATDMKDKEIVTNDKRQAGMPSYLPKMREAKSTEDSDTNDRMELQAVLRPNAGMKGRLKGMVKQAQYNSDDY